MGLFGLLGRLQQWIGDKRGRTRTDGGVATDSDGLIQEKVSAEREDEFVVFHIGMRINAFWKLHRWLPLFAVAPRMVRELQADPGSYYRTEVRGF